MSSEIGGNVSIIGAKTRQVVKEINFEIPGIRAEALHPVGVRIAGDGKLFTANGVSNGVSVIDVKRMKAVKSITVGRFSWGIVVK